MKCLQSGIKALKKHKNMLPSFKKASRSSSPNRAEVSLANCCETRWKSTQYIKDSKYCQSVFFYKTEMYEQTIMTSCH